MTTAQAARRHDPFTTDSARVVEDPENPHWVNRQIAMAMHDIAGLFGGREEIRYKKYFGAEGNWTVGFASVFGFHIRGRGVILLEAIEQAKKSRLPDDPGGPEWKQGVNL
jgi:hypothetical protein